MVHELQKCIKSPQTHNLHFWKQFLGIYEVSINRWGYPDLPKDLVSVLHERVDSFLPHITPATSSLQNLEWAANAELRIKSLPLSQAWGLEEARRRVGEGASGQT